jgi:hypothetical protein
MASATEISVNLSNGMLDAINALLNEGTGDAIINVYAGSIPATCEATLGAASLLGTCVMNATPFQAATALSINANAITDDSSADTSGIASFFRVYSTTAGTDATKSNCHIQGSAGEAADSTDLTLDDKNIVAGGVISITDYDISMPTQ